MVKGKDTLFAAPMLFDTGDKADRSSQGEGIKTGSPIDGIRAAKPRTICCK